MSCLNVGVGSATCGPCPKGYEGDGRSCTDIDEVTRGNFLGIDKLLSSSSEILDS